VGFTRILNEAVASRVVQTVFDIERFIKCTLLTAQTPDYEGVHQAACEVVRYLATHQFIMWEKQHSLYRPRLSLACRHEAAEPVRAAARQ